MEIKPFDPRNAVIVTDIMLQALLGAKTAFDHDRLHSEQSNAPLGVKKAAIDQALQQPQLAKNRAPKFRGAS